MCVCMSGEGEREKKRTFDAELAEGTLEHGAGKVLLMIVD